MIEVHLPSLFLWTDQDGHADWVRDVAWAPISGLPYNMIASAGEDGKVLVWTEVSQANVYGQHVYCLYSYEIVRVAYAHAVEAHLHVHMYSGKNISKMTHN
jgi:WD40 repeat protein